VSFHRRPGALKQIESRPAQVRASRLGADNGDVAGRSCDWEPRAWKSWLQQVFRCPQTLLAGLAARGGNALRGFGCQLGTTHMKPAPRGGRRDLAAGKQPTPVQTRGDP